MSLLALYTGYQYEILIRNKFEVAYLQAFEAYTKWNSSKFYDDFGFCDQTGRTALANDKVVVSAYYGAISLGYKFNSTFKTDLGFEYLSGKDQNDADTKHKSFAPLSIKSNFSCHNKVCKSILCA